MNKHGLRSSNNPPNSVSTSLRRRGILFSALLVVGMLLAACGDLFGPGDGPPVGTVDSVTIDQGDITLEVGGTADLSATVEASSDAARAVNWSTSDADVATVTEGGRVTGVATGTATITATSRIDDTKSDSITVTVTGRNEEPVDPVDPPTLAFTATPDVVPEGGEVTLAWTISGDFTSARITDALGEVVADDLEATGTETVTPSASTVYKLTVNYGTSLVVYDTVRVSIEGLPGSPTVEGFAAEVLPGSRLLLSWTGDGATSWELEAIGPNGASVPLGDGSGNGTSVTADIPSSDTPAYRLTLTNAIGPRVVVIGRPDNVVISAADYDPYNASGSTPEPAIEGTLREVVANALDGTVVGFASDINTIQLPGVDTYREVSPIVDAHLIIDKNLTISGPAGGQITLLGTSAQPEGQPDDITWHSRVVHVIEGVEARLENLVISGGLFIESGAGINNLGDLTIENVTITGNRAFNSGGGIRNGSTGTLTILDSEIIDNEAVYLDDEVGTTWNIRGLGGTGYFGDDPMGDGGGIRNLAGGMITIENSVISGNYARFAGAGIYNEGIITVSADSQIIDNEANYTIHEDPGRNESNGGGVMNGAGATFTMTGGAIDGNQAASQGGGLWHHTNAITTLVGVNVGDNLAGIGETGYGGGLLHNYFEDVPPEADPAFTLTDVTFMPPNDPQDVHHASRERPASGLDSLDFRDFRIEPLPSRP